MSSFPPTPFTLNAIHTTPWTFRLALLDPAVVDSVRATIGTPCIPSCPRGTSISHHRLSAWQPDGAFSTRNGFDGSSISWRRTSLRRRPTPRSHRRHRPTRRSSKPTSRRTPGVSGPRQPVDSRSGIILRAIPSAGRDRAARVTGMELGDHIREDRSRRAVNSAPINSKTVSGPAGRLTLYDDVGRRPNSPIAVFAAPCANANRRRNPPASRPSSAASRSALSA